MLSGTFRQGQLQVLPLNRTDKARRGLLWADVNGDGIPDLLVAQPESGQISIYFQHEDGSLEGPKNFPTLAGVTDLAVADWQADGKPDIFMLSADERQVGVARLDEKQRLPFPQLIPLGGKPLVFAVGKFQPNGKATLAVIVDQDGKRSLVTRTSDGNTRTQKLNDELKSNPTVMAFHDANQDGLPDLVILTPYERVKVLLQVPDNDFQEIDVAPPGGVEIQQPWLSTLDVDGDGSPELLLTQKNFLRAVVLKSDSSLQNSTNKGGWTFEVKEQINGSASNSKLVGAAAVRNGTNAVASLFLLDSERKVLTLCERDRSGVWQVIKNISLPLSEFTGLQSMATGGTNINTVALSGLNAVGRMPLQGDILGTDRIGQL